MFETLEERVIKDDEELMQFVKSIIDLETTPIIVETAGASNGKALIRAKSAARKVEEYLNRRLKKVPTTFPLPLSPVRRLTKGYACQKTQGTHMVDLVDSANGHVVCHNVYGQYADEILSAVEFQIASEKD